MSSIPNDQLSTVPATVRLIAYAIAGGMAGNPVSIVLRDFPPALVGKLWRRFVEILGSSRVAELGGPLSIRQLLSILTLIRLVFVPPHRRRALFDFAWAMARKIGTDGMAPAILMNWQPHDAESNIPGAVVVCNGSPEEERELLRWLRNPSEDFEGLGVLRGDITGPRTEFDTTLSERIVAAWPNGRLPEHCREHDVLLGLLHGAVFLNGQLSTESDPFKICLDSYLEIRSLLTRQLVRSHDDNRDPLVVAMVNRANSYLSMRVRRRFDYATPLVLNARREQCQVEEFAAAAPPRQITLPEIADLGNVQSSLVRNLCSYLRSGPLAAYRLAGLMRGFPEDADWPSEDPRQLAALLRPWSLKQARTRFDSLRKTRIIAATRVAMNGPWQYTLPLELSATSSPFESLPDPGTLSQRDACDSSGSGLPRVTVVGPEARANGIRYLT